MKVTHFIVKIILTLCSIFAVAACQKDVDLSRGGERVVMLSLLPDEMTSMSLGTKSVTESVDEGDADDYLIKDFWIFQYDDAGSLLGSPRYYDNYRSGEGAAVSLILPPSGKTYKVAVIANSHDSSLSSVLTYNSLEALKSSSFPVASSSDLYMSDGAEHDLLMNGVADVTSGITQLNCDLYRNVAKVDFTVNNGNDSGIEIKSVQVKSIPDRLFYVDQLHGGQSLSPDPSSVKFRNLERDVVDIKTGGVAQFKYYLPRNMRGTNSSTTEAGKNVNAPEHATYIELTGVKTATNTPIVYRFYLGANNINDFNIAPNHRYSVTLEFDTFGDENDNRVEDMSNIVLAESNSYIINPEKGDNIIYTVPIENRINTYWQSESGKLNQNWRNYLIDASKEWVAEIVWMDVEPQNKNQTIIKFYNNGNEVDTYRGQRDDRYFSFVLSLPNGVNKKYPCNVVVGVRRTKADGWEPEDGYMWTWHLWITDYDPNVDDVHWQKGQYFYDVTGGKLHSYVSFDNLPAYNNRFIMDRNFGAKGSTRDDGWRLCTGMLYQYGRKDPFPTSDDVWNASGETVSVKKVKQTGSNGKINESVMHPMSFFYNDGEWTSEGSYASYDWNDLKRSADKGQGKSFFDPCPPGWKIPVDDIYMCFGNRNIAYASNWQSTDPAENSYSTKPDGSDAGWMFYLSGEAKTGDTAYFPATGKRGYENGNYRGGSHGALWAVSESATISYGRYLYYENVPNVYAFTNGYNSSMGMPLRCVSE